MQELLGHPSMKFSKGHLLREHEQIICHIPSRKKSTTLAKKDLRPNLIMCSALKFRKIVQQ